MMHFSHFYYIEFVFGGKNLFLPSSIMLSLGHDFTTLKGSKQNKWNENINGYIIVE